MDKMELIKSYIKQELLLQFENKKEYLVYINQERKENWKDIYPYAFRTLKQAKLLADKYQIIYKGKIYFALNDDIVNRLNSL